MISASVPKVTLRLDSNQPPLTWRVGLHQTTVHRQINLTREKRRGKMRKRTQPEIS